MPALPALNDPRRSHAAIELHMRVAAHDYIRAQVREDGQQTILRGQLREDLHLVPRGGVAEENLAQAIDRETNDPGPSRDPLSLRSR
jgi:hypothetical protein